MPAPTGEGVPKKGDRAARDTHTYPTLHASDIEEGEYTYHNPWPLAAGQAAVSNGTTLVPTDITTAAELTAHTGDADAHHSGAAIGNASGEGVTVDADGTVTVKLGDDAPGVQGVNVRNSGGVLVARVDSYGTATFGGSVEAGAATIAGKLTLPAVNAGIEMGSTATANTPYIDFHSSANVNDYDARLMASGGAASHGQGTLSAHAALLSVTGAMRAGSYVQASGSTMTALKMNQFTLADEASARLIADSATPYGIVAVICLSEVSVALFAVFSGGNVTVISDPSNVYRNTSTDGFHCIYWSGSEFILTNRRGGSRQYHIHALTTIY